MTSQVDSIPEVFGSWEFSTATQDTGLSFGLDSQAGAEYAVTQLDLPADPQAAAAELERKDALLNASQAALDAAPAETERFVSKVKAQSLEEASFSIPAGEPLPQAEWDALRLLTYLESGPDAVSFEAGEQVQSELEQADQQFQSALERMLRLVSHFAWVETSIQGRLLGRTVVSWSGDLQTLWGDSLQPDDYWMHLKSLDQALATRNILVHACVVTTQSAAKLAVLLTNPAGAIYALPVAWKLVNQLLMDIEKYQKISNQEMNHAERV